MRQRRRVFLMALFAFLVWCSGINHLKEASAADGLYKATTADGLELKMKRYRPDTDSAFNTGKQPILLFPGIVCNMNEFLSHTPDERIDDYADITLSRPLAEWAREDSYIEEDPMRYYSLAYYLWLKGYDPWFANYRGVGRNEFESDTGSLLTNLDIWACLDTPACIDKVYQVTGMPPIIGGHSTGGLVSYCYLQGVYMDKNDLGKDFVPHVKQSKALSEERNKMIKGFIGIDPANVPPMPDFVLINNAMWELMGLKIYIDVDYILDDILNPYIKDSRVFINTIDLMFGTISSLSKVAENVYGSAPAGLFDLIGAMNFWQVDNTHPYMEDFFTRYCFSSVTLRALSQYLDLAVFHSLREHWKNGEENVDKLHGEEVDPGNDGYYYYSKNINLMTVPSITLLSYYDSLVGWEQVVEDVLEKKTPHEYDEWHVVPDSSHIDIVGGLNAPLFSFPKIGAWLDKVCNGVPDVPDEEAVEDEVMIEVEDVIDNTTVEPFDTGDTEEVNDGNTTSQKSANGKSYCFISLAGWM